MAEFGPSVTEAPQTPAADTVKAYDVREPVELQAASNIFASFREARAGARQSRQDKFLANYTQEQMKLIEAVDQGHMGSRAARSRARALAMAAIEQFPGLRKDVLDIRSSVFGEAGVRGINDVTHAEGRERAMNDAAYEAGFVGDNASAAEYARARDYMRTLQEADRRREEKMKEFDLIIKSNSATKSQIETAKAGRQQESDRYLTETAPAHMQQFKTRADQLFALKGGTQYSEAELLQMLDQRWNEFTTEFTGNSIHASSTTRDAVLKNYQAYYELVRNKFLGKITTEVYEADVKKRVAVAEAQMHNIPGFTELFTVSKAMGENVALLPNITQMGNKVSQYLLDNFNAQNDPKANPALMLDDTEEGRRAITDALKVVSSVNSSDPQAAMEQAIQFKSIFEGIETYESVISKDPDKAIAMVTGWMSTPEFRELTKKQPQLLEQGNEARRIIQANFNDQVMKMITNEFTNRKIINPQVWAEQQRGLETEGEAWRPVPANIGWRSNSGGVEFFAITEGAEWEHLAKKYNKELAPIINKNVRAFAHLDGRDDYGNYFQEMMEKTTINQDAGIQGGADSGTEGGEYEDQLAQTWQPTDGFQEEVEDELTWEDFKEYEESVKEVKLMSADAPALVNLIDKTEGGGSYDTLFGFSNRSRYSNVKLTEMTLAEVSQFAAVNGDYGQWVKGQIGRVATPMGRYQFVGTTLRQVAREMGLNPTLKFDKNTQDAMFAYLAHKVLRDKSSVAAKRSAMRATWEGFKHVGNAQLDAAIAEFERKQ